MAIHKRIGEIPTLMLCLAVWVALVSIVLLLSGNGSYLPGFLLGAAASALYAYLLYHRVPALLSLPGGAQGRGRPDGLKTLRAGWVKTMQPIAAVLLLILLFSHYSQSISFLAALFGFFSFQISLLIYAVLISIDQFF